MKKTFLAISLSFLFLGVSAQWNNTGDSKTTGNLQLGSDTKDYTKLELVTKVLRTDPGSPSMTDYELAGTRDIVFRGAGNNGRAIIRGYTSGGYEGGLSFLSATGWNTQKKRFEIMHGSILTSMTKIYTLEIGRPTLLEEEVFSFLKGLKLLMELRIYKLMPVLEM